MSRSLSPPGRVEDVAARTVLVLAPHYDDEVLGCGGLLVRLVTGGARVRVLFLTDGSGGVETHDGAATPNAAAGEADSARALYASRRRQEAREATAVLGVERADHLGIADGALEQHLEAVTQAIAAAVAEETPDLVLVPSPLEVDSPIIGPRSPRSTGAHPLCAATAVAACDLRVLAYEVNHPAYPDLLVDVTRQIATLERAMACYRSQHERHDYLERGARAAPLPHASRCRWASSAAEGYRRLRARGLHHPQPGAARSAPGRRADATRGRREGPLVSVVVRTRDRPELLAEALASLAASTYRRARGGAGQRRRRGPEVASRLPVRRCVRVDLAEGPRARRGGQRRRRRGAAASYVVFLDDDDLVASGAPRDAGRALSAAGVRVVYTDAAVAVYELRTRSVDGRGPRGWECVERRLPYSRDFDPDLLLVDNYIPFHTLLIERAPARRASGRSTRPCRSSRTGTS